MKKLINLQNALLFRKDNIIFRRNVHTYYCNYSQSINNEVLCKLHIEKGVHVLIGDIPTCVWMSREVLKFKTC